MSNGLVTVLGFSAIAAMILAGLLDLMLASTWAKWYFTSGLLVFKENVSIEAHHSDNPSLSLLEKKLSVNWNSAFTFKELETNQYAFRRNFLSFAWNPITHGLIIFDPENDQLTVKGYLDWFMLAFPILVLIVLPLWWLAVDFTLIEHLGLRTAGYVVGWGLILSIPYLVDRYRLTQITAIAAELWSRKYVENINRA